MGVLYRAVIIGDKESCLRLEQRLATPRHGIPVFNIVDRIESPARAADIVQRIDAIAPQAVIIASHADTLRLAVELIGRLVSRNLSVYATIELYNLITSGTRITSVVSEPLIDISHSKVPPATANIKRIIDVVASASALVVLSPVFAAVALAVKRGSSGPGIL